MTKHTAQEPIYHEGSTYTFIQDKRTARRLDIECKILNNIVINRTIEKKLTNCMTN